MYDIMCMGNVNQNITSTCRQATQRLAGQQGGDPRLHPGGSGLQATGRQGGGGAGGGEAAGEDAD